MRMGIGFTSPTKSPELSTAGYWDTSKVEQIVEKMIRSMYY